MRLFALGNVRYRLEALATSLGLAIFGALPLDAASALGGWLGRVIGPRNAAHRTAERNLRRALPHLNDSQVAEVLQGMWDNLGRVAAEYAHIGTIVADPSRVQVVDEHNVARALKDDGIGALLLSAHFGNWELSAIPGCRAGLQQHNFYRRPNNPYSDAVIRRLRRPLTPGGFLYKGAEGARQAYALLKKGEHIGMLVDQKHNDGIPVPFFGRDAMTTPAPAVFAQRIKVPIIVDKVERLGGARFRITIYTIELAESVDRKADIAETTRRINALFEEWIRERPDLWLWAHRRWPD